MKPVRAPSTGQVVFDRRHANATTPSAIVRHECVSMWTSERYIRHLKDLRRFRNRRWNEGAHSLGAAFGRNQVVFKGSEELGGRQCDGVCDSFGSIRFWVPRAACPPVRSLRWARGASTLAGKLPVAPA
ncbi:MAG: hypothetical protein JXQ75_07795, partial [Phycisphaerae bacterium]|nr:hypothetical protein [Phycisphaerae bacterium]